MGEQWRGKLTQHVFQYAHLPPPYILKRLIQCSFGKLKAVFKTVELSFFAIQKKIIIHKSEKFDWIYLVGTGTYLPNFIIFCLLV